jgi:hypothetical protein
VIAPGLRVLFCGINPGLYSGATGHHFARPGNRFWPTLHRAGFTARQLRPAEQCELLKAGYGVVNLVNRTTATAAELEPEEFVAGRKRLAAKLRRYRPRAVAFLGVGVKNSSSDLLINNCDEFIYYDDLVRADEQKRRTTKKRKDAGPASAGSEKSSNGSDKKSEALDMMLGTLEALIAERGADEKIWGSMVKQALKRRNPGFNETYYGFRAFADLLKEAQVKGLIKLEPDEKSGGYIVRPT